MEKLRTVLALVATNDMVSIWRSGVTIEQLAEEIGEMNKHDRDDLAFVQAFIEGRGIKPFAAEHALKRLLTRAETNAKRRNTPPPARPRSQKTPEQQRRDMVAKRVEELSGLPTSPTATFAELLGQLEDLERPGRIHKRRAA